MTTSPNAQDWQAHLELGFVHKNDKTILAHNRHSGPLLVQRPFYPEGGVCHIYLLHPPAGVVGGDDLRIDVNAEVDSMALLTTPAAGKFYRSAGKVARQIVSLNVAENALLEWLPQETIIYQGARVQSELHLNLAKTARFIGWEVLALGRPAALEGFESGELTLNWHIVRDGALFYRERLAIDAQAFAARWGLQGHSSCGTLFASPTNTAQLAAVQELIGEQPYRGVTRIDDMLICRALDARADVLRAFFQQVWQLIRPDIAQKAACSPRIWAT